MSMKNSNDTICLNQLRYRVPLFPCIQLLFFTHLRVTEV